MTIIDKLKWRYATKKFDNKRILSQSKLDTIKEAFNLTATSYGLQPIRLVILKDKALQSELVQHSMDQVQVSQASHILIFCIEIKIDKNYIEAYFEREKEIRNTPDKILQPFKTFLIDDFNNMSTNEIEDWATKQAYLAMGNLLTICAIENIDACPMEGFSPEKYDEILNLKEKGLQSVLVMPIGYRAKDDMFADLKKVRKKLSNSVINL
jgi:nitroreductase